MAAASYNGDGLRASSTITPSGGTAVTQDYLWNGDSLLMDSANAYIYTSRTAPAEQVNLATGAITYLVTDSLGSVRGTVNTAGALTGSTSYDAWGNPRTSGGLTATTPFGYAGSYTDPDGLIYLVNRYYDPATGQFTSIDPEVRQTLQPYAYTTGDPVTETDPTGLAVNLKGAVAWAKANLNAGYNGFGDDCTDFVSRALHYGGGSPEKYGIRGEVWDDRFWWFVPGIYRSWSHSWSVAHDLAVHLVDIGSPYVKEANAQPGDVIFADWNADTFSLITHCAIITEMKNGTPLMDQHSPTQPNVSLTYWVRTGGKHVHWWIYRPNSG
jgi:RHS repeat-associated protein